MKEKLFVVKQPWKSAKETVTIKDTTIYNVPHRIVNLTGWKCFNIYCDGRLEMRFGY